MKRFGLGWDRTNDGGIERAMSYRLTTNPGKRIKKKININKPE